MKPGLAAASLVLAASFGSAFGHRLDEYLQATTISIEKDRIQAEIHLTPGVAVFRHVLATIDTDRDGVLSTAEQQAYAQRVLGDLSLSADGDRLRLKVVSAAFPAMEQMKEGLGAIQIDFAADVPEGGRERKIVFENHHQRPISAYLVNYLAPRDPAIRIIGQNRNYEQSLHQVDYLQEGVPAWWSGGRAWVGSFGVLLLARLTYILRKRGAPAGAGPTAQSRAL